MRTTSSSLRVVILETLRLTLRALAPGDLRALATMYADPEVMRYIGTGGPRGRDDAARAIDRQLAVYAERGFGEWPTVLRESGDVVGLCGLIVWLDIDGTEELEVAYLLARAPRTRGVGPGPGHGGRRRDPRLGRARARPQAFGLLHLSRAHRVDPRRPEDRMRYEKDFLYEGEPMALFAWSAPAGP